MVNSGKILIIILTCIFSIPSYGRVVSHVEIEKKGIIYEGYNNESEKESCKKFMPTKKQIINFFNLAEESKESGELLHEYYSPCIAVGTVTFKDGSNGRWNLQSSGLGYVFFKNGEQAVFFYRNNKWEDPFGCVYGLDDESSC